LVGLLFWFGRVGSNLQFFGFASLFLVAPHFCVAKCALFKRARKMQEFGFAELHESVCWSCYAMPSTLACARSHL